MRFLRKMIAALLLSAFVFSAVPQAAAFSGSYLTAGLNESEDFVDYGSLLSTPAKLIYNTLLNNVEATKDGVGEIEFTFPSNIGVGDLTAVVLQDAINAFNRDHSEVFWIDFSRLMLYVTDRGAYMQGCFCPVKDNYYTSAYHSKEEVERDLALQNERIQEIAAAAAKFDTNYERLVYIHDWLVVQNSYNDGAYDEINMRAFEAVSALEGNQTGTSRPVCEGYARAFKLLCDALQIPCALIGGEGTAGGTKELHMWNCVKLGERWYGVDVTWDDPIVLEERHEIGYDYFLVGSDTVCGENMTFSEAHREALYLSENSSMATYPAMSRIAYSADTEQAPGMVNFGKTATYKSGIFSDVKSGSWYEEGVASAYNYGLMKGTGGGKFNTFGNVSLAEAITMAARIHAIYHGNAEPVSVGGNWYDAYVAYAAANHITEATYEDYTKAATRAQFAQIFSSALPENELAAVNEVPDGSVKDIPADAPYAAAAYRLYRAGVLIGNDKGEFSPDSSITRAEVALIVSRMILPELRVIIYGLPSQSAEEARMIPDSKVIV